MRVGLLPLLSLALVGCAEPQAEALPADLDEAFFRCQVQPVLTKYCATYACHGDPGRYMTLYARNRLRFGIADETERNIRLSDDERRFNFEAARAMVEPGTPEASLLLLKPVEQAAGGWYHVGADTFGGGDVFQDTLDRDYQVLADWVMAAVDDPACVEPGS